MLRCPRTRVLCEYSEITLQCLASRVNTVYARFVETDLGNLETSLGREVVAPTIHVPASAVLSPGECERTANVVLRLCDELGRFLAAVPRSGPSALALARDLDVDRNLCQRALQALSTTGEPLQALLKLPGAKGLRQLLSAGAARTPRGVKRQPLEAAIEQFEKLVWDLGPSHAKLCARVKSTLGHTRQQAALPVAPPGNRQRHFESSAALVGVEMDLHVGVGIAREMPTRPGSWEIVGVTGSIGLRPGEVGVPLSTASAIVRDTAEDTVHALRTTPLGTRLCPSFGLIEEFSSKPTPTVTLRTESGVSVYFVDMPLASKGEKSDIVLATHRAPFDDPRASGDPVYVQNTRIKYPARHLILDLFIERKHAFGTPWSEAYLWHPAIHALPQRNWHERLPGTPRASVLGPGLSQSGSSVWPAYKSMLAHVFSLAGWSPDDFTGFRCETPYPIWGSTYALPFVFESIPGYKT